MNASSKAALDRYLLRVWPEYKKAREVFKRATVFGIGSLILSAADLISILIMKRAFAWFDAIALTVFLGSLYYLIRGLSERNKLLDHLAPEEGLQYYSLSFPPKLGVATLQKDAQAEHEALFQTEEHRLCNIYPDSQARKAHFERSFPNFGCREMAHRSRPLDDWILSNQHAEIVFGSSEDRLPALNHDQRQLLYSKVSGPSRTTDDKKLSLISDLEVGITHVKIVERTYFDSIVTNEAFRTTLFQKPEKAAYAGELVSSFPELKELPEEEIGQVLYGLSSAKAANHIGASVFALSGDGYPVFFEQGIDQEEGAGMIVVSGTGSADWKDRIPLKEGANFFDIPKRTMVREFVEEAGLWNVSERVKTMVDRLGSNELVIDELAKDVLLIGYFRWVSRFGKPEFLGVTRTDVKLSHLKAQEDEVVKLRGGLELHRQINSVSELAEYLATAKENFERSNIEMNLSSAMLLFRLLEISTNGSAEAKKQLADAMKISL